MSEDTPKLISLGNLQTEAGTRFTDMFNGCTDMETIGAIDTTGTSGVSLRMFDGATGGFTSPNSSERADLADSNGADFN